MNIVGLVEREWWWWCGMQTIKACIQFSVPYATTASPFGNIIPSDHVKKCWYG